MFGYFVHVVYSLYEQVYVAALEFNDFELADICLVKLKKQFSGSSRVKRLEAMRHEATGMYAFAESLMVDHIYQLCFNI
jgi:hypothetical protein